MASELLGIHHVTSIAGEPQRNLDFFEGVLGLRLVKLTVNFDDPGTYHLYYGDEVGHPGTVLTFFPWPQARHGRAGSGQVNVTAFSLPERSLGFWAEHLTRQGIIHSGPFNRFDSAVLALHDADGLAYELVAHAGAEERRGWPQGPIPAEHAIRGFHGITIAQPIYERTAAVLVDLLGFRLVQQAGERHRLEVGPGGAGAYVDLLVQPDAQRGVVAVGTVHHLAFRTPDDAGQAEWQQRIAAYGIPVTQVMDRQYFRSIYFREPGGVLFEIATDPPGFTSDETIEHLGTHLKLPPWYEQDRPEIERLLPPLVRPAAALRS